MQKKVRDFSLRGLHSGKSVGCDQKGIRNQLTFQKIRTPSGFCEIRLDILDVFLWSPPVSRPDFRKKTTNFVRFLQFSEFTLLQRPNMKNVIFCVLRTKIRVLGHFLFENLYYDPLFFSRSEGFCEIRKDGVFSTGSRGYCGSRPPDPPRNFFQAFRITGLRPSKTPSGAPQCQKTCGFFRYGVSTRESRLVVIRVASGSRIRSQKIHTPSRFCGIRLDILDVFCGAPRFLAQIFVNKRQIS